MTKLRIACRRRAQHPRLNPLSLSNAAQAVRVLRPLPQLPAALWHLQRPLAQLRSLLSQLHCGSHHGERSAPWPPSAAF